MRKLMPTPRYYKTVVNVEGEGMADFVDQFTSKAKAKEFFLQYFGIDEIISIEQYFGNREF
jgi:hypothetical protein